MVVNTVLLYLLCSADSPERRSAFLVPSGELWEKSLRDAISSGAGSYLITYDRRWRYLLKSLMKGRLTYLGPSYKRVTKVIHELGFKVQSRHTLWPAASAPRVCYPHENTTIARYLQWTGMIGGGRRFVVKLGARSLLVKWSQVFYPAEALVIERHI